MKFSKKPLLFFLCLASTFTVLAGCNKKTNKNTTNNNTNVTTKKDSTTKKNTTKKDTTKKTTAKQTTTKATDKNIVTKEVFDSYFNISTFEELKALNYTVNQVCEYIEADQQVTDNVVIEVANGNILIDSPYTDMFYETKGLTDGTVSYAMYTNEGTGWGKTASVSTALKNLAFKRMRLGIFDYSSFTYDSNTKSYKAAKIVYDEPDEEEQEVLCNIEIKFSDNVLQSIKYDHEYLYYGDVYDSETDTLTFTKFGETSVTNPMYEEFKDYMVDADTFDFYFDINSESVEELNLTIDYMYDYVDSSDYYQGTIKFNGGIISDVYTDGDYDYFTNYKITSDYENDCVDCDGCYYSSYNGLEKKSGTMYLSSFANSSLLLPQIDMSYFEFDFNSKSYKTKAASIHTSNGTYSNIAIQFDKGNLVSCAYSLSDHYDKDISLIIKNIDNTSVEYFGDNIVDKDTFNSFFAIDSMKALNALNYTANYSMAYTIGGDFRCDATIQAYNGLFRVDYYTQDNTYYRFFKTYESTYPNYVSFKQYNYNVEDAEWNKAQDTSYSIAAFLNEKAYLIPDLNFDDFVFDMETKMYKANRIELQSNQEYVDVNIKFENGKPVFVTYKFNRYNTDNEVVDSWNVEERFSEIGTTQVLDPVGTDYEVNKTIFDKYFGIDTFEELSNLNMTLDYTFVDNRTISGTLEIADLEAMDTYVLIGNTFTDFYVMEENGDKVDFTTYQYNESWGYFNTVQRDINVLLLEHLYFPTLDFSKLTYNSENHSYEATNITVNGYTYSSVSVKFEDGILKSYNVTYVKSEKTYSISAIVSKIGETTVVNPISE